MIDWIQTGLTAASIGVGVVVLIWKGGAFVSKIEMRFDGLETRMGGLEKRMDSFGVRMDRFEVRMDKFETRLNELSSDVIKIKERLKK